MKVWVLAGVFSLIAIPLSSAAEPVAECGLDTRQVTAVAPNVEAPQVTRKAARPARVETAAAASPVVVAQRPALQAEQRRRGVSLRRIPDAMLIDGRGVL